MPNSLLRPIFENDALARGLGDAEARILVEWTVDQAERAAEHAGSEEEAGRAVRVLCVRARAIGCFVRLWCVEENASAAYQLAACERFPWPLPTGPVDACDLMHDITNWEGGREKSTFSLP
jgi:hypothetical protein